MSFRLPLLGGCGLLVHRNFPGRLVGPGRCTAANNLFNRELLFSCSRALFRGPPSRSLTEPPATASVNEVANRQLIDRQPEIPKLWPMRHRGSSAGRKVRIMRGAVKLPSTTTGTPMPSWKSRRPGPGETRRGRGSSRKFRVRSARSSRTVAAHADQRSESLMSSVRATPPSTARMPQVGECRRFAAVLLEARRHQAHEIL